MFYLYHIGLLYIAYDLCHFSDIDIKAVILGILSLISRCGVLADREAAPSDHQMNMDNLIKDQVDCDQAIQRIIDQVTTTQERLESLHSVYVGLY